MTLSPRSPRRARPAAAAGLLLAVALPLAACQPKDPPPAATPSTTAPDATETTAVLPTTAAPGPATTAPAPTTTAPTPATTTTTTATPGSTPWLHITDGGIGPVAYGMGVDDAMGQLTGLLGPADSPGSAGGGFGSCGVTASRWARWGNLQLQFTAHGGPLVLTGFWWGDDQQLPSSPDHPAPVGPGTPTVQNYWDLHIGEEILAPSDALVGKLRTRYPDATFLDHINAGDSAVSMTTAPNMRLVIGLHPGPDDRFLVEDIRSFDQRDITC
jgi:hypothetical protein